MRKLKILLAVLLTALCLGGCSEEKLETSAIAVLVRDETDSGLLLYMDGGYNVLYEQEAIYPYSYYVGDEYIYISSDGGTYTPYNYYTGKQADWETEEIDGTILYYQRNAGYFSLYNDAFCKAYKNEEEECKSMYVWVSYSDDDYFYAVDYDQHLEIYSLDDFELVTTLDVDDSDFMAITTIDDTVCVVTDSGVSVIGDDLTIEYTYVYPVEFDEIENVIGEHIYLLEGEEETVYKLSLTELQLVMEYELDENYYISLDLDEYFADYYDQGYTISEIIEVGE